MDSVQSLNQRVAQLEEHVRALAGAVCHLLNIPGERGSWTKSDIAALARVPRTGEPVDADPVADPTDWEAQEPPHDDLSTPARPA